jgi:hypothetical protein
MLKKINSNSLNSVLFKLTQLSRNVFYMCLVMNQDLIKVHKLRLVVMSLF